MGLLPMTNEDGDMARSRDASGTYTESVSDGDLLHHFDSSRRAFYSSREIAECFDLDRSQAHRRLNDLAEREKLEKVELGPKSIVWWRPRDTIVLLNEQHGITSIDTTTGVASQSTSRSDALRELADALDATERDGDGSPAQVYEEVGIAPGDVTNGARPPF